MLLPTANSHTAIFEEEKNNKVATSSGACGNNIV
jgi:hypothetical protein